MIERRKLKKATDIIEAYRVFETEHPLALDEEELYVNIYKKDINELRSQLILNDVPNKSFFVTGQSGNGKTTALNFLPTSKINEKYEIKRIEGQELFDLEDIDIIDVILMIGLTVVKEDEELEDEFLTELEELRQIKLGKLEKQRQRSEKIQDASEEGGGLGIKLSILRLFSFEVGIRKKYRLEKETRESVRELFKLGKDEIIEKVNDIIRAYLQKSKYPDKDLLIVIDDLEKIRNYEQAYKLFIVNGGVFEQLKCVKIVLFPIWLATKHAMFQNASKFGIRISKNPKGHSENPDREAEINRERLKELVFKRLDNKKLATEKAVEAAVEISGGNLRALLEIMQKTASIVYQLTHMENEKPAQKEEMTEIEVRKAARKMAEIPALAVMRRVNTLDYIMKSHQEPDESMRNDFVESINDNCILAYFNGDPWYDVNPLVKGSVKTYAQNALKPKEK